MKLPGYDMPKRVKGSKRMKGRPITLQEFNELLLKVPAVLEKWPTAEGDADAWRFYLKGLWCSGLRLSESLALRWDDGPGAIVVDYSGKFASTHDLRRSFGFRYRRKVMPATRRELMRHSNIDTTMAFYAGHDAQRTVAEAGLETIDLTRWVESNLQHGDFTSAAKSAAIWPDFDSELAEVIDRWDDLSGDDRRAILAIIRAAEG